MWKIDGMEVGMIMVIDLFDGFGGFNVSDFYELNGELFFIV